MDDLWSVQATVDSSAVVLLAELLDAGFVEVEVDDLRDLMRRLVTKAFSQAAGAASGGWIMHGSARRSM